MQCCPDLRSLGLVEATQRSIDLQPLVQLSALTQLVLGGVLDPVNVPVRAVDWSSAVSCLEQLPSLRNLEIARPDVLLITEMLALTVLTDLKFLQINTPCSFQQHRLIFQTWEVSATYAGPGHEKSPVATY